MMVVVRGQEVNGPSSGCSWRVSQLVSTSMLCNGHTY